MPKTRGSYLPGIADKIWAYRESYGRQSLKRINISTALYKSITGTTYDYKGNVQLFGIETSVYESDKLEYSFSNEVFEINTGKKES